MENVTALCRKYTCLTAMQTELLRRMNICFPFMADLSHAHLLLYVRIKQKNEFLVLYHHKPHTFYSLIDLAKPGTKVAFIEEPLICYSLETGQSIHGKRELANGSHLDTYTFPIKEGNEIIAVLSLETSHEYMAVNTYHHILHTMGYLLSYSRKGVDEGMFQPISAGNGIIICDKNNRVIYANTSAIHIFKSLGIRNLVGTHWADRQLNMNVQKETIVNSRPYEREIQIGETILLHRDLKIDEGGNRLCRIHIVADVTEVRKKDREIKIKSAVIQEIHHRVKNNLQTVASLLRMQARRSKSQEVKAALKESVNRILSISVVHEYLSQQQEEFINVVQVARSVMGTVCQSMLDEDFQLEREFNGPELVLPSKNASKLALIINEMILNSIEHGFAGRNHGLIGLDIQELPEHYQIDIYDDGNGLPEGFDIDAPRHSLGIYIVKTLITEEMYGTLEMFNDNGCRTRITIPKPEKGENEV